MWFIPSAIFMLFGLSSTGDFIEQEKIAASERSGIEASTVVLAGHADEVGPLTGETE